MNNFESIIKGFTGNRKTEKQAYDLGFDCGKNGTNTTNCHFSIFSTPENTKAWERGKSEGEKLKS